MERHWVLHLVCYLETHSDRNLVYSKVIHSDQNSVCSKALLKDLRLEIHSDRNWVCYLDSNLVDCSETSWVILLVRLLDFEMEMLMVMSSVPYFLLDYHLELMKGRNFRTEIH